MTRKDRPPGGNSRGPVTDSPAAAIVPVIVDHGVDRGLVVAVNP
jgi:hypothetical protein